MRQLNPYLNFPGTCEAAFNFYKAAFRTEFSYFSRMGDTDDIEVPQEDKDLVMHVSISFGDNHLMGSDVPNAMRKDFVAGNSNYVCVSTESREEADRLFSELSAGGKVEMPMSDMFWGDYYGSFRDKFGTYWMITYSKEQ
jgi:PhnB protein